MHVIERVQVSESALEILGNADGQMQEEEIKEACVDKSP